MHAYTWMAEQKAAMSTWRFKLSVTHLSTRMWEEPRVRVGLHLLPTVTVIASRSLLRGILISTFRTGGRNQRERELGYIETECP